VKIQIDTNIVIDYALIRQPFYDNADLIFSQQITISKINSGNETGINLSGAYNYQIHLTPNS
jgi:hypothetical protein